MTSTTKCEHSHLQIAATILVQNNRIGGYEAVYDLVCPSCGVVKRNTRLAATIHSLRHTFGWVIDTIAREGRLAEYELRSRNKYPICIGEKAPINPLRPRVEDVPVSEVWACAESPKRKDGSFDITKPACGRRTITQPLERLLGGYVLTTCEVHGVTRHKPVITEGASER